MEINFNDLTGFGQVFLAQAATEYEIHNQESLPDLGKRLDVRFIVNDVEIDFVQVLNWLETEWDRWLSDERESHAQEMRKVLDNHITMYELAQLYSQMQELKMRGEWESDGTI